MSEKNLYDFSNEELKEKFNNDFNKKYSKVYYDDESWKLINEIIDEFNNNIMSSNYPLSLYNESKYKLSKVLSLKKEQSSSNKIWDNIVNVFSTVGNTISNLFSSINFMFSILGLTIVSIVGALCINLLLGNILYSILPSSFTSTAVKSFISLIIFIFLKVYLFIDKSDKHILYDYKKDLIKFICTIPVYGIILYLFNVLPFLQNISLNIYPFLWLSTFTNEYIISPIICLIINCLLSALIFLLINKKNNE